VQEFLATDHIEALHNVASVGKTPEVGALGETIVEKKRSSFREAYS